MAVEVKDVYPPVRQVVVEGDRVHVQARGTRRWSPWTREGGVQLPSGLTEGQFVVHAAIVNEWSMDLIVTVDLDIECDLSNTQIWRISEREVLREAGVYWTKARFPLLRCDRVTVEYPPNGGSVRRESPNAVNFVFESGGNLYTGGLSWDVLPKDAQLENVGRAPFGFDLFVSYKAADEEASGVLEIVRELEKAGLIVWFAPDRLAGASSFTTAINNAIEISHGYLIVWSQNSDDKGGASSGDRGSLTADPNAASPYFRGIQKMNQFWEVATILEKKRGNRETRIYDSRSDSTSDLSSELCAAFEQQPKVLENLSQVHITRRKTDGSYGGRTPSAFGRDVATQICLAKPGNMLDAL